MVRNSQWGFSNSPTHFLLMLLLLPHMSCQRRNCSSASSNLPPFCMVDSDNLHLHRDYEFCFVCFWTQWKLPWLVTISRITKNGKRRKFSSAEMDPPCISVWDITNKFTICWIFWRKRLGILFFHYLLHLKDVSKW